MITTMFSQLICADLFLYCRSDCSCSNPFAPVTLAMWKKSRGFPHQVLLGCSALLSVLRAHHHLALVRLLLRCYLYVFYHYLLPNSALFVEFSLLDIRLYESLGFSLVLDRLFYFCAIVCISSVYYLFLSGVVST